MSSPVPPSPDERPDPMEVLLHNRRNTSGLKDGANMWRTIIGERYLWWAGRNDAACVARLRAAGVRCRRAAGELFVHQADFDLAARSLSEGEG